MNKKVISSILGFSMLLSSPAFSKGVFEINGDFNKITKIHYVTIGEVNALRERIKNLEARVQDLDVRFQCHEVGETLNRKEDYLYKYVGDQMTYDKLEMLKSGKIDDGQWNAVLDQYKSYLISGLSEGLDLLEKNVGRCPEAQGRLESLKKTLSDLKAPGQ